MDDVLYARGQMGMSLAFHIVFAVVGIALPLCMVVAEVIGRRTGDADYLDLARRWSRWLAVLFAVGAVSGTVLSFELGLLFPGFMRLAGALVGIPFSMEGFAFFAEAIFLGIYLYGWDRVRPRLHVAAGVVVAVSGLLSAIFVTLVNAWMHAPRGFRLEGGALADIDPLAALMTPYALHEILHMTLASYAAPALGLAAIHAAALLANGASAIHRKGLGIALAVAVPCSLAQPLVGHYAGQQVARFQPMKLAAMENHWETRARAPLRMGPFEIPGGLSFLATGDPDAVVLGLREVPAEDRPPTWIRVPFLIMVGAGGILFAHAAWVASRWIRRRPLADSRPLLRATVLAGFLGFLALEAGWIVTEVGRQPWIVYGVMRTAAAVTPTPGILFRLLVFAVVYVVLGATAAVTVARQVRGMMGEGA